MSDTKPLYKALVMKRRQIHNLDDLLDRETDEARIKGITSTFEKAKDDLERMLPLLPSGSGFDNGTTLRETDPEQLEFDVSFHHLDEHGSYDGWTHHVVKVTPDLEFDFTLKISGRNRNGIKEYIADVFHQALTQEVDSQGRLLP